jgi:hypothetical protein
MGDYASRERDNQRWEESQKGHPMTEPKDADAEREHPSHWNIYENGVGGWYAWNSRMRVRYNLIHRGTFSEAVNKFDTCIGDYYSSRPAARLEQSVPVEVVEGLVEALRLSITDMGLCQCDVCSRSNAALAAYEQWKAEHRKDSQ